MCEKFCSNKILVSSAELLRHQIIHGYPPAHTLRRLLEYWAHSLLLCSSSCRSTTRLILHLLTAKPQRSPVSLVCDQCLIALFEHHENHTHEITILSHLIDPKEISILRSMKCKADAFHGGKKFMSSKYCSNVMRVRCKNVSSGPNSRDARHRSYCWDSTMHVFPCRYLLAASQIFFGSFMSDSFISFWRRNTSGVKVIALQRQKLSFSHTKN